ncbi:MAG: GTPase Era [Clostridia bacterium]|nr:GTPase Era [Clostridia bacterium]
MKKTGFIAIVGRPNVGKSTLLNSLIGEKLAIVSRKPQTTRNKITGILTRGETQYVFMDTPGMHTPKTKLGDRMIEQTNSALAGVDAVILIVEPIAKPGDIELGLIEKIKKAQLPCILAINKIDRTNPVIIGDTIKAYAETHDFDAVVPMAAIKNKGVDTLLSEVDKFLFESEWFFPDDAITDQPERVIAAEVIREKILRTCDDEIPHGTAVVIEEFKEERRLLRIRAEIFCEKATHKGIIIGKNGAQLKLIGSRAREDLEKFFGTKVFLDLWVKVKENWRNSDVLLANFGFNNTDTE